MILFLSFMDACKRLDACDGRFQDQVLIETCMCLHLIRRLNVLPRYDWSKGGCIGSYSTFHMSGGSTKNEGGSDQVLSAL